MCYVFVTLFYDKIAVMLYVAIQSYGVFFLSLLSFLNLGFVFS